jgi:ABC-type multidrug transport system ATPase subunit
MAVLIKVQNLSKKFSDIKAVDDLSFSVNGGEVYGFLGQNGAGKSTTIRMLLTLIQPDSGDIEIFGMNLRHHRKEILRKTGAIIEKPDLYKYLTALENLRLFGIISGVKLTTAQLMDKLEYVGLAGRAHSKTATFSQGMKQRLGIAVALVHNPDLIILDEPTNGLDPQGIADIRNLIVQLSREEKKTVFISSHLLSEMQLIAESLLIIDKGKKIVEGKMNELINPQKTAVELIAGNPALAMRIIKENNREDNIVQYSGDKIKLMMDARQIAQLNKELVNGGVEVNSLRPVHSLEDYFLSKTQL